MARKPYDYQNLSDNLAKMLVFLPSPPSQATRCKFDDMRQHSPPNKWLVELLSVSSLVRTPLRKTHVLDNRNVLSQNKNESYIHSHKPNRDTAKQENECAPCLKRTFTEWGAGCGLGKGGWAHSRVLNALSWFSRVQMLSLSCISTSKYPSTSQDSFLLWFKKNFLIQTFTAQIAMHSPYHK